jgi:hypothetical protein
VRRTVATDVDGFSGIFHVGTIVYNAIELWTGRAKIRSFMELANYGLVIFSSALNFVDNQKSCLRFGQTAPRLP